MPPKIKEITEYDTSFPVGETLEKHKKVHVHVRTEQGGMDVWVSYWGVEEKGNNIHIGRDIKNDVLRVMDRRRYIITRYLP